MPSSIDLTIGLTWACVARGRAARALKRLLLESASPEEVFGLGAARAAERCGEPEELVAPLLTPAPASVLADQRRRMEQSGARLIGLTDPEYPPLLREIGDPPPVLFARGRPLSETCAVAVVGSRRASRPGLEAARLLSAELARAGAVVVSGFARGVDTAAHRAALQAGGTSWAVLGCGVDVCYPSENAPLLGELLESGTALSEFPMGTQPRPLHFPVRNRIIAGLSRIVLVVEAAERSGSLITARQAAEYGRDVAAVPGSIVSPYCAGSNALLKDGAILVRNGEDLLRELPQEDLLRLSPLYHLGGTSAGFPLSSSSGSTGSQGLDGDAARLLAALDPFDPKDADALVEETGLTAARLSAALVRLELEGLAEPLPGAVFVSRRRDARPGT